MRGHRAFIPAVVAAVLAMAGCGGGSDHSQHARAHGLPGLLGGTGPQDTSAGTVAPYHPTGKIVVDLGFRPVPDGFGFENYGNDQGPQNLTPARVADLFGAQVCVTGTGASCKLTPIAQDWMKTEDDKMAGGHCMGFSVTALRFFGGDLKDRAFGAASTAGLPIQGNVSLQSLIAEDYVYQDLQSVQNEVLSGSPTAVLHALIKALRAKRELYTIAIFKSDGTGGHGVTPYAVEDKGGGKFAILIYDNNFPGVVRAIQVDTKADTWRYTGGPNPADTSELYEGDDRTQSLLLYPTSPGLGQQPCPFCGKGSAGRSGGGVSTKQALAKGYNEVTLIGNPANHAHLLLEDNQVRHTGFLNGKIVNQIPGAEVVRSLSSQAWATAPEPSYRFPATTNYAKTIDIYIDGTDLKRPDTETLHLIGPGFSGEARHIRIRPGQTDRVTFSPPQKDGYRGFDYTTDSRYPSTVELFNTHQETVHGHRAWYLFDITALGVKHGATLTMLDSTHDGYLQFYSVQKRPGRYDVILARVNDAGLTTWENDHLFIPAGQVMTIGYRKAPPHGRLPIAIGTSTKPPHFTYADDITKTVESSG